MTNVENIRLGDSDIAFVRKGGQIVWPQYAGHENIVLWYDFSGRRNTDAQRGIAEDLSGNGNNGVLNGFSYESGSGYQDNGLATDGVNDYVQGNAAMCFDSTNFSMEFVWSIVTMPPVGYAMLGGFGHQYAHIGYHQGTGVYIFYRGINGFASYVAFSEKSIDRFSPNLISLNFDNKNLKIGCSLNGISVGNLDMSDGAMRGEKLLNHTKLGFNDGIYVNSNIKSIRKISRLLTPAEIQTNYLIDKQRFNLP